MKGLYLKSHEESRLIKHDDKIYIIFISDFSKNICYSFNSSWNVDLNKKIKDFSYNGNFPYSEYLIINDLTFNRIIEIKIKTLLLFSKNSFLKEFNLEEYII